MVALLKGSTSYDNESAVARREKFLKAVETLVRTYYPNIRLEDFPSYKLVRSGAVHPISILVSIVLSQNTSDKNAGVALRRLKEKVGEYLDPLKLMKIPVDELEEIIKPSGMQHQKSRTIVNILKEFKDNPEALMREDPESLRNRLLGIAGVGPKTADVFLLFVRGYPTFPMDTHIRRFLERMGIGRRNEPYEKLRKKVLQLLPKEPEFLLAAHLAIIMHGRKVCKARNPLCRKCVINFLCPYHKRRFQESLRNREEKS